MQSYREVFKEHVVTNKLYEVSFKRGILIRDSAGVGRPIHE